MKHLTTALFITLVFATVFATRANAQAQTMAKPQLSIGPEHAFLTLMSRTPVTFPITTGTAKQLKSLIPGKLPEAQFYLIAVLPLGEALSLPTKPGEVMPEGKRLLFRMTEMPQGGPALQIFIDPKKSPTEFAVSAKGWRFKSGVVISTESSAMGKVLELPADQKVWAVIVPMYQ